MTLCLIVDKISTDRALGFRFHCRRLQTPDIRGPQVSRKNPKSSRPPLRRIWRSLETRGLRLPAVPSLVTRRPSTGNEAYVGTLLHLIDLPFYWCYSREPPLPENATRAIFVRHLSGGEVRMVRGPYAMLADYVRDLSLVSRKMRSLESHQITDYAKLMRKRYKEDGKPVDLQTLRASTAQARGGATGGLVDSGNSPPLTPTKSSDTGSPSTSRTQRLSVSSGTGPTSNSGNSKGSQIYQMSISGPPPPSPSELPLPGYVPPENNYMPTSSSSGSNLPPQPSQQQSSSAPSVVLHPPGPSLPPPSQISGHHHQYQSHHPPPQVPPHPHPHQSLPPPPPPGPPGPSSGSTGVMPPWLSRGGYAHGSIYRGPPGR